MTSYLDLPANLAKTYELMRTVREQRECHFDHCHEALILELTRLHSEAHSLFHQNQCLLSELQELCNNKKSLTEEIERLKRRICELEKELAAQTDRVRQLRKENTALSNTVKELESQLRVSRDELARIREEVARLREVEKKASWLSLLTTILLAALCGLLATTLFLLLWLTRCNADRERLQIEVTRLQAENCASQRQPSSSQRGRRGKKGRKGDKGDKGDPGRTREQVEFSQ